MSNFHICKKMKHNDHEGFEGINSLQTSGWTNSVSHFERYEAEHEEIRLQRLESAVFDDKPCLPYWEEWSLSLPVLETPALANNLVNSSEGFNHLLCMFLFSQVSFIFKSRGGDFSWAAFPCLFSSAFLWTHHDDVSFTFCLVKNTPTA